MTKKSGKVFLKDSVTTSLLPRPHGVDGSLTTNQLPTPKPGTGKQEKKKRF